MSKPRACWLVPDDRGGGVISVAEAACRQINRAGYDATMLMMVAPTGHGAEFGSFAVESLEVDPPYTDAPARLMDWLARNPQDVLLLNGCDQYDDIAPYVPPSTRMVYCVHDTARRCYSAALRHEESLDAIVAVSNAVADLIRPNLRDPSKLRMIYNGTIFPTAIEDVLASERSDDLVYMGGENPGKGAYDLLRLWPALTAAGFTGRLHWCGTIGADFRAQIEALPHVERILIHGRLRRSALFEVCRAAKVLLMLSRVEPFGMATIEAMGTGCLTVAWDIETGTTEIVAPRFRHFAELGDFDALAASVLRALHDHAEVFEDSTRDIRARFDESVMGAGYAALLADLAAHPASTRAHAGETPPGYTPPRRFYQYLPAPVRAAIARIVGRWPKLGYAVRDLRGL